MSVDPEPPFDLVVIGATGDLAQRKLLPALYDLDRRGRLAARGRIFGAARAELDRTAFIAALRRIVERRGSAEGEGPDEESWRRFAERITFLRLDATDPLSLGELQQHLDRDPAVTRVFYLATAPEIYGRLSGALGSAGVATPSTRIVLEKPIGQDLRTAREINRQVGAVFDEQQVFRIDHYLGKETVQNLMALRFGNALFEALWRAQYVDHVQITVAETLGVEGRQTYDGLGALRDMVQNHLLQVLCLIAMEPPVALEATVIREEKVKVLRALRPIVGEAVKASTLRGQYRDGIVNGVQVPGYRSEPGIAPDSTTETFVALKAQIDNWRWAGVPFYLRTGKRLQYQVSEVVIQFKHVPHLIFDRQRHVVQPNRLVIRLQPHEFIRLTLMTKDLGPGMNLRRKDLNLDLSSDRDPSGHRAVDAYERLLLDVFRGVTTLFIHRDEVEAAWRWVDPIHEGWESCRVPLHCYPAGVWGPVQSDPFLEVDGRRWYEHDVR